MADPAVEVEQLEQRLKIIRHGLSEEERVLSLQNYVEFLAPHSQSDVYVPLHTLTASELKGMSQASERLLRKYGCMLIKRAGAILRLP